MKGLYVYDINFNLNFFKLPIFSLELRAFSFPREVCKITLLLFVTTAPGSKDLVSNEQNKNHIGAELRKKEQQLSNEEEKLFNACSSQDLEQDLSKLQEDLEKVSKQRGEHWFLQAIYNGFLRT